MVELPDKNVASYRQLFQRVTQTAQKYNDTPADAAPEDKDLVILETTSEGIYSQGDEVKMQAELASGKLTVERKNDERRPYKATLSMQKTEDGFTGHETLHDVRGLVERDFLIRGEQVEVLSETHDRANRYDPKAGPDAKAMQAELNAATDTLQYLISPSFS